MWKPAPNFEGLYEVSDDGQIRSCDKMIKCANWRLHKGQIIKGTFNSRGYRVVTLTDKDGKKGRYLLHRIIASAFCERRDGCDVVNHLDFNPANNRADNLEWTTAIGNMRYSAERGRFKKTGEWKRKIIDSQKRKAVIAKSLSDGTERMFESVNDTKRFGFQPSCVSCCCTGKRATHAGFSWRFVP